MTAPYTLDQLTYAPQQSGPGKVRGFTILAHNAHGKGRDKVVFRTGQIYEGMTPLDRLEYSNYILRALLFEELSQATARLTGEPLVLNKKSLWNDVPTLLDWVRPWRPI